MTGNWEDASLGDLPGYEPYVDSDEEGGGEGREEASHRSRALHKHARSHAHAPVALARVGHWDGREPSIAVSRLAPIPKREKHLLCARLAATGRLWPVVA